MEQTTTKSGSVNVTEDTENRVEFRRNLSVALERPLPTLGYLLTVLSAIIMSHFKCSCCAFRCRNIGKLLRKKLATK